MRQNQSKNQNRKPNFKGRGNNEQGRRKGPGHGNRPPHGRGRNNRPNRGDSRSNEGQYDTQSRKPEPKKEIFGKTHDKPGRVIEHHVPKRYAVIFYDTFAQAKNDAEKMKEQAKSCDQLNIVIKAEGDMADPDLRQYGMVYAGAAWHLIHTRRVEEGWYNEPR